MDALMNNYLLLGVAALAALPLVLSTLGGLLKGAKRAILRLILVVASFVAAFIFKDQVVEIALGLEISGQTIVELINSKLPEQFASLSDQIIPLLTAVVTVLVFFVVYLGLMIGSWIVYLILCIFVKKGMGKKKRKHRLVGLVAGAAQGVFAAITLTMPLVGLICDLAPLQDVDLSSLTASQNANTIEYRAEEGEGSGEQATEGSSESFDLAGTLAKYKIDLKAFANNEYIKKDMEIIAKLEGFGYGYTQLSTATKTVEQDGETVEKKITIGGQIEAISAAIKLAGELTKVADKFSGGFDTSNPEAIQDIFNSLDSLFGEEMSEEAKETVNELVNNVAADLLGDAAEDFPIDLSTLDLTAVDFATEGEVIANLMTIDPSKPEEIDVANVVENLASSTLILPILESSDITVELGEEQKEAAQAKLAELQSPTDGSEPIDAETLASIQKMLGLTTDPAEPPAGE